MFKQLFEFFTKQFIKRVGRSPQTPAEVMSIQDDVVRYLNKTKGVPEGPKKPPFQGFTPKVIEGGKPKEGIESVIPQETFNVKSPLVQDDALRIKQGLSTRIKLNSENENAQMVKDLILRKNKEFNSLDRTQQKEILDRIQNQIKESKAKSAKTVNPDDEMPFASGGVARVGFGLGKLVLKDLPEWAAKAFKHLNELKSYYSKLPPNNKDTLKLYNLVVNQRQKALRHTLEVGGDEAMFNSYRVGPYKDIPDIGQKVKFSEIPTDEPKTMRNVQGQFGFDFAEPQIGQFTKAEVLIKRLENTIKESKDPYVQETFPNFIKEIKANPKLANNENVWKELGGDLPYNQRLIVHSDDSVTFQTRKGSPSKMSKPTKTLEGLKKEGTIDISNPEVADEFSRFMKESDPKGYKDIEQKIQIEDFDVTGRKKNASGGIAGQLHMNRPGYASGTKKKKKEEDFIDSNYIPSTLEEMINAIDIKPRAKGSFTEGPYGPENEQRTWSDVIGAEATVDLPWGFELKGDYDKRRIKDRLYSPDDEYLDERVRADDDRWKLELLWKHKFGKGGKKMNQGGIAGQLHMNEGGRIGFHRGSLRHQKEHDYQAYEKEGNLMKYLKLSGDRAKMSSPEHWINRLFNLSTEEPAREDFETMQKERFMYGEHKPPSNFEQIWADIKGLLKKKDEKKAGGIAGQLHLNEDFRVPAFKGLFTGSKGLQALIKRLRGEEKTLFPKFPKQDEKLIKTIMPRETEAIKSLNIQQLENMLDALKNDKKMMAQLEANKAMNDPGLDFLMGKMNETGLMPKNLGKYTDIDKDIMVVEQMLKNRTMTGRKLHASGGRAGTGLNYLLGEDDQNVRTPYQGGIPGLLGE